MPTHIPACLARDGWGRGGDVSSIGHCPECGRSIPPGWTLIEYDRADGDSAVFAECPSCASVVRPA